MCIGVRTTARSRRYADKEHQDPKIRSRTKLCMLVDYSAYITNREIPVNSELGDAYGHNADFEMASFHLVFLKKVFRAYTLEHTRTHTQRHTSGEGISVLPV